MRVDVPGIRAKGRAPGSVTRVAPGGSRVERWMWGAMWYCLMVVLLISIPAMAHRGFWVWD